MPNAQYQVINMTVNDLKRITLPSFQRKFVWSKRKKEAFIATLHEGLPFGAVLVYPKSKDTNSELLILDGQQRLSTIREFQNNPLKFWKPLNSDKYEGALQNINAHLADDASIDEKSFDELLRCNGEKLDDWLDEIDNKDDRKAVRSLIHAIKREMRSFVDLEHLQIPAIEFLGSQTRIAEVFSNLNQGGIPLSKYELFNAAWIHTEIPLLSADQSPLQEAILSYVKQHYAAMSNNTEFELEDFSEDELTQKRVITLSELGTALGMYIRDNLNAIIPQTDNSALEIGFGVLGIAAGVDNRQLANLIDQVDMIKMNLQIILEKVERICSNLQDIFSKILKRLKSSKNNEYAQGLSTTFKTLSYFAALWDLNPDSADYILSLKNIRAYYVHDSLTKAWSSHGDQRLLDFYPASKKRTYLEPISKQKFWESFSHWISDNTAGINFTKEATAITTIHANLTYLSTTIPYGESYELEHIIPRKLINQYDNSSTRKILGNSIGNCMYLPRLDNNKKKDKTLYDVNENGRYDKLIESSLYFDKRTLDAAIESIKELNFDAANQIINQRASAIAKAIITQLLS